MTLELRSDLAEIDALARGVEAFAAQHGVAPAVVSVVNLALEEVVTNIISYGYADGGSDHVIRVHLDLAEGSVLARVEDEGRAFDPLQKEPPDIAAPLEERSVGGLGIHFVKSLMDEVTYSRENDTNILFIRKRLGS